MRIEIMKLKNRNMLDRENEERLEAEISELRLSQNSKVS